MQYVPVLTGEASGLRAGVEGILDGDDQSSVNRRLQETSDELRKIGATATFGMEIECTFAPDPESKIPVPYEDNPRELYARLYEKVFERVQGRPMYDLSSYNSWRKGSVVRPKENPTPLMGNKYDGTYNTDEQEDICEFRTGPATARTAQERYWNTIDAIGQVAAQNGLLAILLSTHVNGAVLLRDDCPGMQDLDYFMRYTDYESGRHLAATQHNLNASRPLQASAGLRDGWYVHEAFPYTKDASTTIYEQRLEFRHPAGAVDPRIDMLAFQTGLAQMKREEIPEAALENWREAFQLEVSGTSSLAHVLRRYAMYKMEGDQFIIPAQIEDAYTNPDVERHLGRLMSEITDGRIAKYRDETCHQLLVDALGALEMHYGEVRFKQGSRNGSTDILNWPVRARFKRLQSYITPELVYESPRTFEANREEALAHPIVREMFGSAITSIIPATEAAERRQQFVDQYMA